MERPIEPDVFWKKMKDKSLLTVEGSPSIASFFSQLAEIPDMHEELPALEDIVHTASEIIHSLFAEGGILTPSGEIFPRVVLDLPPDLQEILQERKIIYRHVSRFIKNGIQLPDEINTPQTKIINIIQPGALPNLIMQRNYIGTLTSSANGFPLLLIHMGLERSFEKFYKGQLLDANLDSQVAIGTLSRLTMNDIITTHGATLPESYSTIRMSRPDW